MTPKFESQDHFIVLDRGAQVLSLIFEWLARLSNFGCGYRYRWPPSFIYTKCCRALKVTFKLVPYRFQVWHQSLSHVRRIEWLQQASKIDWPLINQLRKIIFWYIYYSYVDQLEHFAKKSFCFIYFLVL